jgi:hypothetical protein
MRHLFIRNLDAPDLFLSFLISAVGAILGIRFYLHLTGYPQIGGNGLHIAHMLWGGLLLLAAVVLILGFLDRNSERTAAVVAGIGWGTFIDELGKFITQDHNYFFTPTVALIYVSFVMLYLIFRALARRTTLSADEYEANAMRVIEEALLTGMTVDRRERVLAYLSRTHTDDPIARAIADMVVTLDAAPAPPPSPLQRLHEWIQPQYERLVMHRWFRHALELFFGFHVALGAARAAILAGMALDLVDGPRVLDIVNPYTFAGIGTLLSSSGSALMVAAGIFALRSSRARAYSHFRTAVLISILLTEFFVFLEAQFAALPGFALNLFVLFVLNELISQERDLNAPTDELHSPSRDAADQRVLATSGVARRSDRA